MSNSNATTKVLISIGIAGLMILSSWVLVELGHPDLATTAMFLLIAIAAGLGVFNSNSGCRECDGIRNLFGRRASVKAQSGVDRDSGGNPFARDGRELL